MEPRAFGNEEAIEVKISKDMPLPTPRSVICSPIHMMTPVPAHRVMIITRMCSTSSCGIIPGQFPRSTPERAIDTIVVALRSARAIVR